MRALKGSEVISMSKLTEMEFSGTCLINLPSGTHCDEVKELPMV